MRRLSAPVHHERSTPKHRPPVATRRVAAHVPVHTPIARARLAPTESGGMSGDMVEATAPLPARVSLFSLPITSSAKMPSQKPKILLMGATGYVGGSVLHHLLAHPDLTTTITPSNPI
ncbi:nad dependent epimerase dehydratase family protein, partial [Colletotrichum chrysophilum]